ncbi:MAG: MBL fold metallo-hydrolase [Myxococcales bacterium]|nr:MBL fold metallo-hydrolase [Myxococcales bacterium]
MTRRRRLLLGVVTGLALFSATLAVVGLPASSHPAEPADLGTVRAEADLVHDLERPGPIEFETVVAADWEVPLSGLLNLDAPEARAAGLEDRDEPIQIFFHVVRHPTFGLFVVDTGVEWALANQPESSLLGGLVGDVMHRERIRVKLDMRTWLARQNQPLRGVFLTHLHTDHIEGLPDVPLDVPVYAGRGETHGREFSHAFTASITDQALAGHPAVREWKFPADTRGVVDVFGDGSFWALQVPGHTAGSTAYLARTTTGPVLMVGDTCHTAWGWVHGVEPGSFTSDQVANRNSLHWLKQLTAQHPTIQVRLGHQWLTEQSTAELRGED